MALVQINGITLDVDLPEGSEQKTQPFGSLYLITPDVTLIPAEGEWIKAAGTYQEVNTKDFLVDEGKLIYDGIEPVHVHGAASFTAETVAAYKTIEYGIGFNGTVLQHAVMARRHQSVDIGTGAIHYDTVMDVGDYVEFFVRNVIDGTNVRVINLYIFAMGMI